MVCAMTHVDCVSISNISYGLYQSLLLCLILQLLLGILQYISCVNVRAIVHCKEVWHYIDITIML